MELRHLRYFVAVAEDQNVTRAASRLRLAQPSLSRQIRDLEDSLGLSLFERSAKSLRLTDAGRTFLGEALAVLHRAEEAIRVAQALAGGKREEIHVGYAPSLTVELLPRALRAFHAEHPDTTVRLHDLSTQEMIDGLREKRLHVALMIRTTGKAMSGIRFEPLRHCAVCVAAHPAHPLAQAGRATLGQVARERLIAYTRDDYPEYHAWLEAMFSAAGFSLQIAEEHDAATSLIASVEAGRGIALVQQGFDCLAGPRLSVFPLDPPPPPFVVGVASIRGRKFPAAEAFVSAVKASR